MKRGTSKISHNAVKSNPYRITREIREAIDEAKMSGEWACELEDKDFDFLTAGAKDASGKPCDEIIWEDVFIYRKGKRESVEASREKTAEDLLDEEAERSRLKRETEEKKGGRLKRPEMNDYHPKVKQNG